MSSGAERFWRAGRLWLPRALLVSFFLQTAVYCVRPAISYQALAEGASATQLGVIAACYGALSLAFAIPVGRGVDRWGPGPFLVFGVVTVSGVGVLLVVGRSLVLLGAATMLLGLGHILTTVALQTLLANRGGARRRDDRFAALTVIVSVGHFVGPALGGLLAHLGSGAVFGTGALLGAGAAGTAATLLRSTRVRAADKGGEPPPKFSLGRIMRLPQMPHAMLASIAVITSNDVLVAYLPVYGEDAGIAARTVGFLLAALAIGAMVSRFCMSVLVRAVGRGKLLAASAALPAVVLAVFPVFDAVPVLFAAMVLAGLGLGLGQPLSLAWIAANSPRELRGTALGVRLSGNRLGQIVIPAAVGALAGVTGLAAVFWALTGMLASSAVLSARASFEPTRPTERRPDQKSSGGAMTRRPDGSPDPERKGKDT